MEGGKSNVEQEEAAANKTQERKKAASWKRPPRSPRPTGGADYGPSGRRADPGGAGAEVVTPSRDLQQELEGSALGPKPLVMSVWTLRRPRGPRSPSAGGHHPLCPPRATSGCHLCGRGAHRPAKAIAASLEGWPVQCLSFSVRL